jgi:chaperonin GroES
MAKKKPISWLTENIEETNLIKRIDEDTLAKVASRCIQGYTDDVTSCTDWRKKTEDGLKVAKQVTERKTFPWDGAANIKYPLIATAAIQFAARSYPQILNGPDIIKAQVIGADPDGTKEARAKRISQHMSYQVLEQMTEWETDMDQLLHGLPIVGTYFKKTFFDPLYQRNRSMVINPFELVINMKHKGTIETARRITQEIHLYKNEVIERENAGLFKEGVSAVMKSEEASTQELFIEQHCWYDLDGDGYEEPYIFTIHSESNTVVRAVANYDLDTMDIRNDKIIKITPIQYFTKFTFIPSPDGDFYDIGFAHLLGPINEAMSTLINQLLDAGSLANTGGGFISKGLRWQGGNLSFSLGEWKPVDTTGMPLKDAIMPLPVREPSGVLFQLLGLLNDIGNKLASVSDAMSGETPSQNTPASTTLATIEQGLKVFTAIYKRVFRALKSEFKKMYRLNSQYLEEEEYFRVLDTQQAIQRKDYGMEDMDVSPAADPNMSSEAQKLARANALLQTMQLNMDPVAQGEILRQYYDALDAKNIELLVNMEQIKQAATNPPPDPEAIKLQLETQKAQDAMTIKLQDSETNAAESMARILKLEAEIELIKAQTLKVIAEAEGVEPGRQMQEYKLYAAEINNQQKHDRELKKIEAAQEKQQKATEESNGQDTQGADAGMAPQPDDQGSVQIPPGAEGIPPGGTPLGPDPAAGLMPPNGAPNDPNAGNNLGAELPA